MHRFLAWFSRCFLGLCSFDRLDSISFTMSLKASSIPSPVLAEVSRYLAKRELFSAKLSACCTETARRLLKSALFPITTIGGLGSFSDRQIWEMKSGRALKDAWSFIE